MPSTRRRFLTATAAVAGTAGLAGCAALDTSPYDRGTDESSEWPFPNYDASYSAYAPDAAVPRNGVTTRWSVEPPARASARPVVADETVLVVSPRGLTAYDVADGSRRWRVLEDRPLVRAPVVVDGVVYVGVPTRRGPNLLAYDLADGSRRWATELDDAVGATLAPDRSDGDLRALFVGDHSGTVYQINPTDGSVVVRTDLFGVVERVVAGRTVLVGTEGGEVYSLLPDGDGFRGLWRRKLDGTVTGLSGANVDPVAATFGGPVYRLGRAAFAGRTEWQVDRGGIELATTGRDVVACDGGGLSVYDYRTGDRRWQVEGGYSAGPAVAGDLLVAGGGELGENGHGFVAAYDLRGGPTAGLTGRERWRFETEDAVVGGVAVADGAVFAVTQGVDAPPKLYALDPA
jgi:outer membrane protein assembly factor BamB